MLTKFHWSYFFYYCFYLIRKHMRKCIERKFVWFARTTIYSATVTTKVITKKKKKLIDTLNRHTLNSGFFLLCIFHCGCGKWNLDGVAIREIEPHTHAHGCTHTNTAKSVFSRGYLYNPDVLLLRSFIKLSSFFEILFQFGSLNPKGDFVFIEQLIRNAHRRPQKVTEEGAATRRKKRQKLRFFFFVSCRKISCDNPKCSREYTFERHIDRRQTYARTSQTHNTRRYTNTQQSGLSVLEKSFLTRGHR